MKNKTYSLLVFLAIILVNQLAYSKPKIVVTIAPIASLVSMLVKDQAEIVILDKSGGCPHHHNAKPSDKFTVTNSQMVIYIDDNFDHLISSMLLDYEGVKVKISDFPSIDFKSINGEVNWHFWLDLKNVNALNRQMAKLLIQAFPQMKNKIQQNLDEAIIKIDKLDNMKQSNLADLAPVALLSDSLEHFFKSINNSQVRIFQTANSSLKNIKKLDDSLNSDSIKCIVVDIEQNNQAYLKYNKLIIEIDSENWALINERSLSGDLFIDKYSKMINQLKLCK